MTTKSDLHKALYARQSRLHIRVEKQTVAWSKKLAAKVPLDHIAHVAQTTHQNISDTTDSKDKHRVLKSAILPFLKTTVEQNPALGVSILTLIANLIAQAKAEAITNSAALLAIKNGTEVPDLAATFTKLLAQLESMSDYGAGSAEVLSSMLAGLAGDLAPTLSKMIDAESAQEIIAEVTSQILQQGIGSTFYLSQQIQTIFAQAQLNYLQQQGLQDSIWWIGVGDDRECVQCLGYESDSPYTISTVPSIPAHGGCRCWYSSSSGD